jgi:hypothetical protein
MESWREVWRTGFSPQLSLAELQAMEKALETDDPRLLQGATTSPPPLECVRDWPVEAACVIGFCGWQGDGLDTVAEVEEFFAQRCFAADKFVGEPASCRHFLNWADDTPRNEMRAELLPEVKRSIELLAVDGSAA